MIRVEVTNAHPRHRVRLQEVRRLVACVLKGEEQREAEVGVVFSDDKRMKMLNKEYLRHNNATDVLSFPLHDGTAEEVEGEVYVNVDQAERQAREYGVTRRNEIARLVIHGTLHLLGYDDSRQRSKAAMTRREDHYLMKMNYGTR